MSPPVLLAVGAVVLLALMLRERSVGESMPGTDAAVSANVNAKIRVQGRTNERATEAMLGGASLGLAVGGPAGMFIVAGAFGLGSAIYDAINHETYGRIARDEIAKELRRQGYRGTAAQTDGILWRNFLLSQGQVAATDDGRVGLIVQRLPTPGHANVGFGLPNANREILIAGFADVHIYQRVTWQIGDPDVEAASARKRATPEFQAFLRAARVGDVYPLEYYAGASSHNVGAVWTQTKHARILLDKAPASAKFRTKTVTTHNVDELAARWDAATGATWEKS